MNEIWQTMESAPIDGTWFVILRPSILISTTSKPWAIPELSIIHRYQTSEESPGYWKNSYQHSVADSNVKGCLWAPLDALPFIKLYNLVYCAPPQPIGA